MKTSRLFLLLRRTLSPPSRRVRLMNGNVEDLILKKCYLPGRPPIKMTSEKKAESRRRSAGDLLLNI